MKELVNQIKAKTGQSKIQILLFAKQYVDMGLCPDVVSALKYMLEIAE